jgi:hypothetical protein
MASMILIIQDPGIRRLSQADNSIYELASE